MDRTQLISRLGRVFILGVIFLGLIGCAPLPRKVINFDSRTLTDDTWGAPIQEKLTSGLFLNKDKTFGWYWDRNEPIMNPGDSFVRPIYPNVLVGGTTNVRSNSKYFPIKLGDVNSITFTVFYQYLEPPTGEYNLAFEMLLSDSKIPNPTLIPKAEVMIWLQHTFGQPPDTYNGEFTDGNNTFGLYSWIMSDGRSYFSFILVGQSQFQAQYSIYTKKLLDDIDLNPNWYILGVQLGNEVVSGSGRIQIENFKIKLNGHEA